MNNVAMSGMNAMGGPVGGGMPMMNNGAAAGGIRPPGNVDQKQRLNTYIYEYFLRNGMFDCARALLSSNEPLKLSKESPQQNSEEDNDSKDDIDSKRPDDLPLPDVPKDSQDSCFLYEWWCLFWDVYDASRSGGSKDGRAYAYLNHTQNQSRARHEQQVRMVSGLKGDMSSMPTNYQQMMMARGQSAMNMQQNNELRQKAIQNTRNGTPQQQQLQIQMLQQQAQQNKQQQMQRDPSEGNGPQRAPSPGSAENAPSPSKRPRLDAPFNQQMPNGRGQTQGMPQQFQGSMPGNANSAARLAGYQATLSQQQAGQMAGKSGIPGQPGGPQNQGSPMMTQGQDGGSIANYYNPGDIGGPNGMRGPNQANGGGGNHALQDYQMQLMLLEQQNKKRLMMARQEQDSMSIRPDGPGGPGGPGMGPNGQAGFAGTSPQGARSVNSPNPSEQMKRGMVPGGMPSPVPEGQNRGSPSAMNFNGGMDPNLDPKFYQMNGMAQNMMPGAMTNGMRPPSSHPGGAFAGQMNPQQMAIARQGQNWQQGPNGQMVPGPNQATPQQNMGTPRQGAMPPPSAPAANANANGRTQPSSPQQAPAAPPTPSQTNKANPKKKADKKADNAKRPTKKGSAANLNAGATPSADAVTDNPTPTPQTPITPVHPSSFQKNQQNGAVQPATNGQPAAAPVNAGVPAPPPDMSFGLGDNGFGVDTFQALGDFTQPGNGSMDVLQDFDFDSFLHQDGDVDNNFNFDAGFMDEGQLTAE